MTGDPHPPLDKTNPVLALSVERDGVTHWLIANGMMMGRWTWYFGVNCLADTHDCKEFVRNIASQTPNSVIRKFSIEEEKG